VSHPLAAPLGEHLERLERAVAGLAPAKDTLEDGSAHAVAVREALSDHAVNLLAARTWERTALPADTDTALVTAAEDCGTFTVATDADRADPATGTSVSGVQQRAVHALEALVRPDVYDGLAVLVRRLAGPRPDDRLREPWLRLDDGLAGLEATRHEWAGQDLQIVAAGCQVLVDRFGRLLVTAALIDAARAATVPSHGQPPSLLAERPVTAARRYTWNHLRLPAPEAAVEIHLLRTRDLLETVAAWGTPAGEGR
jgi:hypothetical protein